MDSAMKQRKENKNNLGMGKKKKKNAQEDKPGKEAVEQKSRGSGCGFSR